jgi:hypothetical protein
MDVTNLGPESARAARRVTGAMALAAMLVVGSGAQLRIGRRVTRRDALSRLHDLPFARQEQHRAQTS